MSYTKPTISVVIPTYNRANTIVECIDSALSQSYKANEILIIDDCSNDDTIEKIEKYKEKLIILKTITQSGAQVARNIGIKAAKSNWIAFLDSDDVWLPKKLEKQISFLKIADYNPMTVIHGNCYLKNDNSDEKTHWQLESIDGENVYKQLLSKSGTLFPSILTSKNALEKINYLDEKTPSYHEWDTAIRLAKYCRFIHIHEPLFIYNIHKNTISKNSDLSIEGYNYIITKYQKEIKELCGEKVLTDHLVINSAMALNNGKNTLGRAILEQISNKYFKKYIFQLLSYLRIKPKHFKKIKQLFSRTK